MYKKHRALLVLIVLITVAMVLSSCSDLSEGYAQDGEFIRNENPTAIVVILGRHANAMAIPEDAYRTIDALLQDAVYGGYVCAIICDGKPTAVNLAERDFFEENARNGTVLKQEISDRVKVLSSRIKDPSITANDPETDLLAALREAANALAVYDVKDIANKQIIVIDSGISTTGDSSFFRLDLLRNRPSAEDEVKKLKEGSGLSILPNLTGVKVTFIGTADGMAEVAAPQQIATADKAYIRDYWTGLVEACGASEVQYESAAGWSEANMYTDTDDSVFPFVSQIPFEIQSIVTMPDLSGLDFSDPDNLPELPAPPAIDVRLGSEVIGFKPGKDEFINPATATYSLRIYAQEIKEFINVYRNEKIWLMGTTTTYSLDGEGDVNLGLLRADKVKTVLVEECGIPEDNLLTIGLGARFPWRINEFPNGEHVETLAQENRAVWLMTNNDNTERFKMLEAAYNNGQLLPEAAVRFGENMQR